MVYVGPTRETPCPITNVDHGDDTAPDRKLELLLLLLL